MLLTIPKMIREEIVLIIFDQDFLSTKDSPILNINVTVAKAAPIILE